jgi:hypothetical protein
MTGPAVTPTEKAASEWPDVIRVSIWLVQDGETWQSLAAEFDIAEQGASQGLALKNLQELVIEYLESCIEDGMSFEEALRPIPMRERLRLQAGRLMTPIRRLRHKWITRDRLIFPIQADGHVHC